MTEQISGLSTWDLQLTEALQSRFGMQPVGVTISPGSPELAPVVEVQSVFDVVISAIGERKI